ncbi:MAG: hypothetical protein HYX43_03135 [Burkholderiales bacterium]|nr:hypothetical protein [Burkholderiales bacterium]
MQPLVNIVEQLSEAAAFIRRGGIAHERLALLLLDNAAEVLLQQTARSEISRDNRREQTFKQVLDTLPADAADEYVRKHGANLLSPELKNAAMRHFGSLVDVMVQTRHLDRLTGEVIKALHRYRNDAYHRATIREETLRAAAILYLEIACDLFISFPPTIVLHNMEHWAEYKKRFGLSGKLIRPPGDLLTITEKLKQHIGMEGKDLGDLLAEHLSSRLEDLRSELRLVSTGNFTAEEELVRIQFWYESGSVHWGKVPKDLRLLISTQI